MVGTLQQALRSSYAYCQVPHAPVDLCLPFLEALSSLGKGLSELSPKIFVSVERPATRNSDAERNRIVHRSGGQVLPRRAKECCDRRGSSATGLLVVLNISACVSWFAPDCTGGEGFDAFDVILSCESAELFGVEKLVRDDRSKRTGRDRQTSRHREKADDRDGQPHSQR